MIGTGSQRRPGTRIFYTFRHWPQVPTGDLLQLRQALASSQEPEDQDAASELLRIINADVRGRGGRRVWRRALFGARTARRPAGPRPAKPHKTPDPAPPYTRAEAPLLKQTGGAPIPAKRTHSAKHCTCSAGA